MMNVKFYFKMLLKMLIQVILFLIEDNLRIRNLCMNYNCIIKLVLVNVYIYRVNILVEIEIFLLFQEVLSNFYRMCFFSGMVGVEVEKDLIQKNIRIFRIKQSLKKYFIL